MNIQKYKQQLQENVIDLMTEMMGDVDDCGFTKEDIAKCEALILAYLSALESISVPTNEEIMEHVKALVLALNELSEETDYCMIETEEREAIWEIIQDSAVECGLTDPEDDITEEWRDW